MKISERRSYDELALPLVDALYATAARMTDPATAEDLVQETLVKAWRGFGTYEQGTNFKAWIFRILTNTFISDYRRRSRGPVVHDFSETDVAEPDSEMRYLRVDDIGALKDQLGDTLKQAVDRLPAEFRLIFLLSALGEFSYREISEIAAIPIGTVMSRLFRARHLLRQELAGLLPKRGTAS